MAAFKTTFSGLASGLRPLAASSESGNDKVCERKKRGEIEREIKTEREADIEKPSHRTPPALPDTDL